MSTVTSAPPQGPLPGNPLSAGPKEFAEGGRLKVQTSPLAFANVILGLALCASVVGWFSTIKSPLWLDETVSYWQISGGFWRIWQRQGLSFPAYSYILWATKSLFGSGEVVLRIPSVLAMLAAACLLYQIAKEFFEFDVALIVTMIFCFHPIVSFAAVDARPYAFAILIVNCAILTCLRWVKANSNRYAVAFGISAAGIFYFHYLFGLILLALGLLMGITKRRELKSFGPRLAVASVIFSIIMLPVIPRLLYMFRTGGSHVFAGPPHLVDVVYTLAPGLIAIVFAGAMLAAVVFGRVWQPNKEFQYIGLACVLLAGIPLGMLYGVSTLTNLHIFMDRYRLVAVSGVALCWGALVNLLRSKMIRLAFSIALVAFTLSETGPPNLSFNSPHGYTWKYALEAANQASAPDNAPVLICSDLPESNSETMPTNVEAATSGLFAQMSYYKVNSPVIPLPREFNEEAALQVEKFLATAIPARRRFLVLAFAPSWHTIDWITNTTKNSYQSYRVGTYEGVAVMEYVPR